MRTPGRADATAVPVVLLVFAAASVSAQSLSWSPQGDRLVYEVDEELLVADAYSHRTVAALGPGHDPKWSPAGDWILFTRSQQVFLVQADGSNRRQVGDGRAVGWSPDGDRFAFWQSEVRSGELIPVIFIEEVEGANRREIALGHLDYNVFDWWSIGIACHTVSGQGIETSPTRFTTVLDPDTGRRRTSLAMEPRTASWSPSTSRLAYFYAQTAPDGSDEDFVPEYALYVQEGMTGERMEIGENLPGFFPPSWSPDGRRLAFDGKVEEDTREIFVAEGEGLGRLRRITFDSLWNLNPHWSPAGDQIAFFRSPGRHHPVWFLDFVQVEAPTGIRAFGWGEIKRATRPPGPP